MELCAQSESISVSWQMGNTSTMFTAKVIETKIVKKFPNFAKRNEHKEH